MLVTVVDGLKAAKRNMLMSADVDVGFVSKKTTTPNQFDAGEMSKRFVTLHNKHLLTVGQMFVMDFQSFNLMITVSCEICLRSIQILTSVCVCVCVCV